MTSFAKMKYDFISFPGKKKKNTHTHSRSTEQIDIHILLAANCTNLESTIYVCAFEFGCCLLLRHLFILHNSKTILLACKNQIGEKKTFFKQNNKHNIVSVSQMLTLLLVF